MADRGAHLRARHRRTASARVNWALALGTCTLVSIPVGLLMWTPSAAQEPAAGPPSSMHVITADEVVPVGPEPTGGLPTSRPSDLASPAPRRPIKPLTLPHMAGQSTTNAAPAIAVADTATPLIAQAELLALVRAAFPADEVTNAMAVADCESGQQSIVGQMNNDGSTDWGIFQLNDAGTLQSALSAIGQPAATMASAQAAALDPQTNVSAAARIFAERGWSPWVCAYKQGIVSALWSNDHGSLYGKYAIDGTSTFDLTPTAAAALPTPSPTVTPVPPITPSRPSATPIPTRPPAPATTTPSASAKPPRSPRPTVPSPSSTATAGRPTASRSASPTTSATATATATATR